jgi:hypothetical protein
MTRANCRRVGLAFSNSTAHGLSRFGVRKRLLPLIGADCSFRAELTWFWRRATPHFAKEAGWSDYFSTSPR